ncbi:M23 family metallopeptidase [Novosphingobium mangrovi (ex Huang et al. 2023)]|uniref:M23 family metallopeptidase n=1 Tax=Novosphingobium mangrovi (ex Huang et al. 2023) TaxID=2976432 RepID=A0ABT2I960_9SPHN|nr:M23 family metallopeptidase [Novosphingobium mangrovi (ex Huang et al. 2023)]MCT2401316.1 M23 family metallopeptidase [Novosphingobium mangrovi (ex Huang et al. 2023)]
MFKALDQDCEDIGENAANAAVLTHAQALEEPGAPWLRPVHDESEAPASPGLAERFANRCRKLEAWCHHVDLAPDLANDIGSRKWLRGLATLVGLSAVAVAMWPDFSVVEAATAVPAESRERDEFRSQTIAPLALGADSGRHMGASPLVRPLAKVPERPTIQLVSTLGQGDSFTRMLKRAGLGGSDISRVSDLVESAVPMDEIASGTQFDITLGQRPASNAPRALDSIDFRARFDLDLSIERDDGGNLAVVRHPIAVDETPLRIRGTIGSSLYRSARNAGAPVAAIQAYLRAVDKYVRLDHDLGASDEYDMIVAYKRSARGERQVGDLLYAGIERDGKPRLQLLRWGDSGDMFSVSSIDKPRAVPIGQPVAGRITSRYGMRRHPILGYTRMHAGIDFGARYGSPIYAVADGTVTYAGRHGGHGNYVRLQHAGGLGTGYGHMSRIAVSSGAHVRAGQVIGYVGSTGLSTGPHLHFEAYRGGHTINPANIQVFARPQIAGKDRDAFKARLTSLLTVEPGAALGSIAPVASEQAEAEREIDRLAPKKIG